MQERQTTCRREEEIVKTGQAGDTGAVVFRILEHRRLPLTWLAQRTGIHISVLSRVRAGQRTFSPVQRVAIAAALDLPLDVLFAASAASRGAA
jgi:hypothetical protein